jgi:hypothetical protein
MVAETSMPKHILILIHGTSAETATTTHADQYQQFWSALQEEQPALLAVLQDIVEVEWGNPVHVQATRPDERLAEAARGVGALIGTKRVHKHASEQNVVHPGPLGDWNLIPGLRSLVRRLREELVHFGLADAVYYTSQDGERAVRQAVYGQVLQGLRKLRDEDVMLHVVGHSLGVTVMHDFLYGLFGKPSEPDFLAQAATPQDSEDYAFWRQQAQSGQLQLGSFTSMASQLPLFALRKQTLVDQLARGKVLDPAAIGVAPNGQTQWLIVYDVDDPLGFATRELYGDRPEVRQVQVDAGDTPVQAHLAYWQDPLVISETAQLIATRAGAAY